MVVPHSWRVLKTRDYAGDDDGHEYVKLHQRAVLDVAYAPSLSLKTVTMATASADFTVAIVSWKRGSSYLRDVQEGGGHRVNLTFTDAVWSVSWSEMGTVLAVACANNEVSLYQKDPEGNWTEMQRRAAA